MGRAGRQTYGGGSVKQAFEQGDSWVCDNANCGAEMVVMTRSELTGGSSKPRCTCGSTMSKSYVAPGVRKLDSHGADIILQKLELLRQRKS
jgi:hypothetical protein